MRWYAEDFTPNSDALVIALGSFIEKPIDPNRFEWYNMTLELSAITNFKKLFIRDIDYAWWQTQFEGLKGYGPHVVANFIKEKVKESKAKRVLITGASAGGYGSILFACLCKLDLAIAISPQTSLSEGRYIKYKLHEKYTGLTINKEEIDLKVILERYGNNYSKYHVYFGKYNISDSKNAERISHFPGVELFPLESDKHTVGGFMKNNKMLQNIILKFIEKGV